MNSLDVIGPQLSVLVAAGLVLLVDSLLPQQRRFLPVVAMLGLIVSALWTTSWVGRGDYQLAFDGTLALDKYAVFFYYVFAGITATVVLASIDWVNREGRGQGEYYALVLTVCGGLMLHRRSRDLITFLPRPRTLLHPPSTSSRAGARIEVQRGGLKYLLSGDRVVTPPLRHGPDLRHHRTTLLPRSRQLSRQTRDLPRAARRGDGPDHRRFGFKMAVVPIQMWVPDVYQGAPTPVGPRSSRGLESGSFRGRHPHLHRRPER